eukprot:9488407-Pyramimonas_sp.AAC.1
MTRRRRMTMRLSRTRMTKTTKGRTMMWRTRTGWLRLGARMAVVVVAAVVVVVIGVVAPPPRAAWRARPVGGAGR